MDIADALAVVREQHHAVLTTSRGDGTPQMSPVAVAVHHTDHLLVSSRITAYKTRNLQRDPRAWLCVLPDNFFGRWIQIEGETEIVELPDAMPPGHVVIDQDGRSCRSDTTLSHPRVQ